MGLETCLAFAQEQPLEPTEKDGSLWAKGSFGSEAEIDPSASPAPIAEELDPFFESNELERLPPVDSRKNNPAEFDFGPRMGPGSQGPIGYRAFWFPSVPLRGQSGDWGLVGQDLSLACPLWAESPNTLLATGRVSNRLIDTDAILPDSRKPYPSELWNAQMGLMYLRNLNDDRMIGGGVNVGSASDHPFASLREMNVSMNAMYRLPSGEHNAWLFMLMYPR